jgi:hypothetical protein
MSLVSTATGYEPQATMMSPPQIYHNSGNLPPANPFPADASGYNQQQNAPNPSWGAPSLPQYTAAPHKSASNKKLLMGVIAGALLLGVIGVVLYYLLSSDPSAKMNPYKGSLEDLAPKDIKVIGVGVHTRTGIDNLGDRDKEGFGNVKEIIGATYKYSAQTGTEEYQTKLLIGNYSSAEDAQDGLSKFKNKMISTGGTVIQEKPKELNGSKVGLSFRATRNSSRSKEGERYLPDGATIVYAQAALPTQAKKTHVACWTNGSVLFAAIGQDQTPFYFEGHYDTAIK